MNSSQCKVLAAKVDSQNKFELRNYHEHMETFFLKPEVEHGAYRQFIKRDKRKNLKVNK